MAIQPNLILWLLFVSICDASFRLRSSQSFRDIRQPSSGLHKQYGSDVDVRPDIPDKKEIDSDDPSQDLTVPNKRQMSLSTSDLSIGCLFQDPDVRNVPKYRQRVGSVDGSWNQVSRSRVSSRSSDGSQNSHGRRSLPKLPTLPDSLGILDKAERISKRVIEKAKRNRLKSVEENPPPDLSHTDTKYRDTSVGLSQTQLTPSGQDDSAEDRTRPKILAPKPIYGSLPHLNVPRWTDLNENSIRGLPNMYSMPRGRDSKESLRVEEGSNDSAPRNKMYCRDYDSRLPESSSCCSPGNSSLDTPNNLRSSRTLSSTSTSESFDTSEYSHGKVMYPEHRNIMQLVSGSTNRLYPLDKRKRPSVHSIIQECDLYHVTISRTASTHHTYTEKGNNAALAFDIEGKEFTHFTKPETDFGSLLPRDDGRCHGDAHASAFVPVFPTPSHRVHNLVVVSREPDCSLHFIDGSILNGDILVEVSNKCI